MAFEELLAKIWEESWDATRVDMSRGFSKLAVLLGDLEHVWTLEELEALSSVLASHRSEIQKFIGNLERERDREKN